MKSRNVVVSLFLVLFLIAAGGAWWLRMSVDGLVKQAIERVGPQLTGVTVKVDSVRIQAAEGSGMIKGLVVGNPQGFEVRQALALGEIRLAIDASTITKDVVVIKELLLVAPDVYFERGQGGDNLLLILKNADAWAARDPAAKKDVQGKKFVVESLAIRGGKAHFGGSTAAVAMPSLLLKDVGRKSNGVTADEVARQALRAVQGSASVLAAQYSPALK